MQTTPGSYAVKPINDALDSLPLGQVSGVLEGPDSFHILKVKTPSRRPGLIRGGPGQDQAHARRQEISGRTRGLLAKIKRNALIIRYASTNGEPAQAPR